MPVTISPQLKTRLDDAIALTVKGDPKAGDNLAAAVIELAQSAFPPEIVPSVTSTILELREEIKWQGDEFNQIDSKTGITLGFILIFAGQLLTLCTTKRTDLQPFLEELNKMPGGYLLLCLLTVLIALSLAFGVRSRWPRDFRGSAIPKDKTALTQTDIYDALYAAVAVNRETNKSKSLHSKLCNLFAALSLLAVLLLIAGGILQIRNGNLKAQDTNKTSNPPAVVTAPAHTDPAPPPVAEPPGKE